jgi:hypothetical protein
MARVRRVLVSLVVILAFTVCVCAVQPKPVYASSSTTTILIVLGSVIGGLALFALIMTLIVRNNPAWMPLAPGPDLAKAHPWEPPESKPIKFGLGCGVRPEGVPLLCWR